MCTPRVSAGDGWSREVDQLTVVFFFFFGSFIRWSRRIVTLAF